MQGYGSDSPNTGDSYYNSSGSGCPSGGSGSQVPSTGSSTTSTPVNVAGGAGGGWGLQGAPQAHVGWGQWFQQQQGAPPAQMWHSGRSQSAFGDYRPNMDAVHHPVIAPTPISIPPPQSFAEFDSLTLEQMGINPASPVQWENPVPHSSPTSAQRRVQTPVPSQRARGSGHRDGRKEGGGTSVYYTDEESMAVAKAWSAISNDPQVGTDQTELGFWARVLGAYNQLKPREAPPRNADQVRKKWKRIQKAVSRWAPIYERNKDLAESGRSEADIQALSHEMHKENKKYPRFTYWNEYLVLRDDEKFRAVIAQESQAPPKRTRLGASGQYSSSSGSHSLDLNEEVEEEPPATSFRRRRPIGQQRAIRGARAGPSVAASASRLGMTPQAEVLSGSLRHKHRTQLIELTKMLKDETDPSSRRTYKELIDQLKRELGLTVSDNEAADAGNTEVAADSGDETE